MVHGELERWKHRNGFSYPERVEHIGWEHIWERNVVMELNSFIAFPSPQEASIVKHVLSEGIQSPEVSLAWIARLSRYFYKTIV